MIFPEVCIWDG